MKETEIRPRIPIEKLIPAWDDLSPERRAQIEIQINSEWWLGYYAGLQGARILPAPRSERCT